MPPDVRWRLRPTGGSILIIPGLRPLSWGIAPDSMNSSRKGTALPHIGRHSRKPRFHTVVTALGSVFVDPRCRTLCLRSSAMMPRVEMTDHRPPKIPGLLRGWISC